MNSANSSGRKCWIAEAQGETRQNRNLDAVDRDEAILRRSVKFLSKAFERAGIVKWKVFGISFGRPFDAVEVRVLLCVAGAVAQHDIVRQVQDAFNERDDMLDVLVVAEWPAAVEAAHHLPMMKMGEELV